MLASRLSCPAFFADSLSRWYPVRISHFPVLIDTTPAGILGLVCHLVLVPDRKEIQT